MSGLYDPNRTIHYRLEGRHARPLCKCKLKPGTRPRMLSRMGGVTLPPPIKPEGEGTWTGTCSLCYERAQKILKPHSPLRSVHEDDLRHDRRDDYERRDMDQG